jgi:hypothetical protein
MPLKGNCGEKKTGICVIPSFAAIKTDAFLILRMQERNNVIQIFF